MTPEFKFSKTEPKKRSAFFAAVSQYAFYYYAIVINKKELWGGGFRYRRSFYKVAVRYAITLIGDALLDAKVVLDKTGEKAFTKSLQAYLKKQTRRPDGTPRIKKVSTEDSKKNDLLQLADMVCSAVAQSFNGKSRADRYRLQIVQREKYVQVWPR